jgi:hypothetical protein
MMTDSGRGNPSVSDRALFEFFEMLSEYYDIPNNWFLRNSPIPEREWMRNLTVALADAVTEDLFWDDDGNIYKGHFEMNLPKSDEYLRWYEAFNETLLDLGMGLSEWYESLIGNRSHYVISPWEDYSLERLKETGDYFWFLVLFLQRFGSSSEYETSEVRDTIVNLYELGHEERFNIAWFKPLDVWMKAQMLRDEFNSRGTMKSFSNVDFSNVDFTTLEADDVSAIPEYDVDDNFISRDGKFYHRDKVLLAITAAGGFAQALERQDLEPKITNVATLLGKGKRKKKK